LIFGADILIFWAQKSQNLSFQGEWGGESSVGFGTCVGKNYSAQPLV